MKKAILLSVSLSIILMLIGTGAQAKKAKKGLMAKVGFDLAQLYAEYEAYVRQHGNDEGFKPSNPLLPVRGNQVIVDIIAHRQVGILKARLEGLGLKKKSAIRRMISGRLPIRSIKHMANLTDLRYARPAYAMINAGLVTSQGDEAMGSDIARSNFGIDGSGVMVGVMSDSFDCQDGAAADVASGDLPAGIVVLAEETGCASGSDEGRALMQIIHDVAPGASMAFHTAFDGQADFAAGIQELADLGASIIVDDIIYFAEPMFQDGIIAQAVDSVAADGVAYFSSAGNQARNAYQDAFNGVVTLPPDSFISLPGAPPFYGGEIHNFGDDIVSHEIIISPGATMIIAFQWDDPFFSVCGSTVPGEGCNGADTDMDMYLLDESGMFIITGGVDDNIDGDPVEIMGVINNGAEAVTVNLIIVKFTGPDPEKMKYVRFARGQVTGDHGSGTIFGHANANMAEAVGAAFYGHTPAFGQNPALLEPFSSAGPTPILFDADGNRLDSPAIRNQPGIVAPDGTNTTFFYADIDADEDDFPNFFGTSASAPHAAGVAALMLDADPGLSPAEIFAVLEDTASDMDDPSTADFDIGFDFATGYGLIQADLAVEAVLANLCPGNSDRDFDIDGFDLAAYLAVFKPGACEPGESCDADLNGDGRVDTADINVFANVFGQTACLDFANSAAAANLR